MKTYKDRPVKPEGPLNQHMCEGLSLLTPRINNPHGYFTPTVDYKASFEKQKRISVMLLITNVILFIMIFVVGYLRSNL